MTLEVRLQTLWKYISAVFKPPSLESSNRSLDGLGRT